MTRSMSDRGEESQSLSIKDESWLNTMLDKYNFIVLVFFRGDFCPFCKAYLQAFSLRERAISREGGYVVAVCAQSARRNRQTQKAWGLQFPIYSDPQNLLAKRFRIAITPQIGFPTGMCQPGVVALDQDWIAIVKSKEAPPPSPGKGKHRSSRADMDAQAANAIGADDWQSPRSPLPPSDKRATNTKQARKILFWWALAPNIITGYGAVGRVHPERAWESIRAALFDKNLKRQRRATRHLVDASTITPPSDSHSPEALPIEDPPPPSDALAGLDTVQEEKHAEKENEPQPEPKAEPAPVTVMHQKPPLILAESRPNVEATPAVWHGMDKWLYLTSCIPWVNLIRQSLVCCHCCCFVQCCRAQPKPPTELCDEDTCILSRERSVSISSSSSTSATGLEEVQLQQKDAIPTTAPSQVTLLSSQ